MFLDLSLVAWSTLALAWWLTAWRETLRAGRGEPLSAASHAPEDERFLTIFKPLAPIGSQPFQDARGLESFVSQLDDRCELLLGAHRADEAIIRPFAERMRARYPAARLEVIWREKPDAMPNPKVAWLWVLARHARGDLWLWSDSDITAPPGFLRSARVEFAAGSARMITWPYAIRAVPTVRALPDALFVNAELLPGVLFLRRRWPVDFGLGAAMLFARVDFEAAVDWEELGHVLAEDFMLGQALQPVHLGEAILTTDAEAAGWRAALLHYLRWSKTIRWNRPLGTAARLAVLPALGWMAEIVARPDHVFGWMGLVVVMQIDVLFGLALCGRAGCGWRLRYLPVLLVWSLARGPIWLVGWLPWPVVWRRTRWWGPCVRVAPDPLRVDKA